VALPPILRGDSYASGIDCNAPFDLRNDRDTVGAHIDDVSSSSLNHFAKGITMKRQVIALALGSLFALPALANNEIDAGNLPQATVSAKSAEQVRAELLAAKQSGNWMVNAERGTQSRLGVPTQLAGKSRGEVRDEVAQSRATGNYIVNAELGTTARQL
jgi:hypothetical protein